MLQLPYAPPPLHPPLCKPLHHLTTRDIEILQTIDRFKYLTSSQIASLFGKPRQAINKRLKLPFHHHYIGKLPAHLSPKLFNSPDVYYVDLDRKAKHFLTGKGIALPHQNIQP